MLALLKKLLVIFLLCICGGFGYAQKISIGGKVTDTLSAPLSSATVMLLNASDSSLVNFTVTHSDGSFKLRNVSKGNYQVQVTFVGFSSYRKQVIATDSDVNLATIAMTPQTKELDEIVIEGQRAPVTVKRDTIEFNAASFKTKANANVEDLLKKLPGVEVENDGTVKAQGENVQRVTVDGREFFGRDPKVATRNLPADAVDKVQVFDKKSDQTLFTGIDDGQREKTINLELKEEKRNGAFGSLMAGAGTTDRFQSKASINKFTKKKQLSFLGMANNINDQGFSIGDYMNFSGSAQQMMSGGGGAMRIELSDNNLNGVPLNIGNQDGITSNYAGGVNFNKDFSNKTKAGGSYFASHLDQDVSTTIDRINYLPGGNYTFNQANKQRNVSDNHRLNFSVDHQIDSANSLKLTANVGRSDARQNTLSESFTYDEANQLQNESTRSTITESTGMSANSDLLYRHKFPRKGRSFSTNLTLGLNQSESDGDIGSINQFYGGSQETQNIAQENLQETESLTFGIASSFTEPLGGRKYLEVNYNYRVSNNDVNREVWNVMGGTRLFDSQLSNKYNSAYVYNRPGLNLRMIRQKFNIMVGASWQNTSLNGNLIYQNVTIDKTFENILPVVRFNYDFSTFKHLRLDYETSVQEPTIQELQPVINNNDPLNLTVGNPDLKPGYVHRARTSFTFFDPASFVNLFSFINVNYTTDAISTSQSVDSKLVRTTQPVNVPENYSVDANIHFGFPFKKLNSRFGIRTNALVGQQITLLNNEENPIQQRTIGGRVSYTYTLKDFFIFDISTSIEQQQSLYEFSDADQLFLNKNHQAETNLTIAKKYQINASFQYLDYSSETTGFSQTIPMLDIFLSRFVLKNNSGELKLGVVNLLDRNLNITQTANTNYLEQRTANNLGRYFMLSFTYALNKQLNPMMGGGRRGHFIMR